MLDYPVTTLWEIAVHLTVVGLVYDGVFLCCLFSHEMFWMRSGTELNQLVAKGFPTFSCMQICQRGAGIVPGKPTHR